MLVEDARGQPPTIPFWLGDKPGRSDELSATVSALRQEIETRLESSGCSGALDWLLGGRYPGGCGGTGCDLPGCGKRCTWLHPNPAKIVLERFFDDTGDMHLVIHAPLGSRIMRAWGLALRKRFCRHFNFELQAAALEDSLILSLGETHSFDTGMSLLF